MQKRTFEEEVVSVPSDTPEYEIFTYKNGFFQHSQMHTHDYLEIGLCLQGSGLFFIKDKVYLFETNSVSIIGKGVPHIAQSPNSQLSEWIFINIKTPLSELPLNSGIFNEQELFWLLKMIAAELQNAEGGEKENVEHLAKVLISIANREKGNARNYEYNCKLKKILPALSFIIQKRQETIQIDDLASVCHFHTGHFRRLFKEVTGCSPIEYIQRVRLKEAALLLSQTEMSVIEISEASGFQTLSHFNRSFLNTFGMSPTKYRNNSAKN